MTTDYRRTRARVIRAGNDTAHLSIPAWCGGQITIRAATADLVSATGLSREQLPGADLMVTANVAATVDTDVDPDGWQFLAPADDQPPTRRSALSDVAA
jgi:hypothetical protein